MGDQSAEIELGFHSVSLERKQNEAVRVMSKPDGDIQDSSDDLDGDMCRICGSGDSDGALIAPCNCTGSLRLVHCVCLQKWIVARPQHSLLGQGKEARFVCEVCHQRYKVGTAFKFRCNFRQCRKCDSLGHIVEAIVVLVIGVIACALWPHFSVRTRTFGHFQFGSETGDEIMVPVIAVAMAFLTVMTLRVLGRRWIRKNSVLLIIPASTESGETDYDSNADLALLS